MQAQSQEHVLGSLSAELCRRACVQALASAREATGGGATLVRLSAIGFTAEDDALDLLAPPEMLPTTARVLTSGVRGQPVHTATSVGVQSEDDVEAVLAAAAQALRTLARQAAAAAKDGAAGGGGGGAGASSGGAAAAAATPSSSVSPGMSVAARGASPGAFSSPTSKHAHPRTRGAAPTSLAVEHVLYEVTVECCGTASLPHPLAAPRSRDVSASSLLVLASDVHSGAGAAAGGDAAVSLAHLQFVDLALTRRPSRAFRAVVAALTSSSRGGGGGGGGAGGGGGGGGRGGSSNSSSTSGSKSAVPYRGSKLTRLVAPALGACTSAPSGAAS